jgi:hypothetical protein
MNIEASARECSSRQAAGTAGPPTLGSAPPQVFESRRRTTLFNSGPGISQQAAQVVAMGACDVFRRPPGQYVKARGECKVGWDAASNSKAPAALWGLVAAACFVGGFRRVVRPCRGFISPSNANFSMVQLAPPLVAIDKIAADQIKIKIKIKIIARQCVEPREIRRQGSHKKEQSGQHTGQKTEKEPPAHNFEFRGGWG